jgi:sugar/nucleoside kinase (ribokinase family)
VAKLDIVGLGLSTLDVLVRLKDMPAWDKDTRFSGFGLDGGGMVGTACVAAARLGAHTGYIGVAGNDISAELKLRSFKEAGVDLSRLVVRQHPESHIVIVYVNEETGERHFCGLRDFNRAPVHPAELDRDYITSATYLHLDTFNVEAAQQAIQWMHAAGKKVSIDCSKTDGRPVSAEQAALVRQVDILICGSGFGLSLTGQHDLWEAGKAMLAMGPSIVVQTEGENGSYTTTAQTSFHTPAFTVDVVDTTGAGDVFHGAYLVGLLHGWDLQKTALFATAVSAIECTKLGGRVGIPTYAETVAFLRQRGFDFS